MATFTRGTFRDGVVRSQLILCLLWLRLTVVVLLLWGMLRSLLRLHVLLRLLIVTVMLPRWRMMLLGWRRLQLVDLIVLLLGLWLRMLGRELHHGNRTTWSTVGRCMILLTLLMIYGCLTAMLRMSWLLITSMVMLLMLTLSSSVVTLLLLLIIMVLRHLSLLRSGGNASGLIIASVGIGRRAQGVVLGITRCGDRVWLCMGHWDRGGGLWSTIRWRRRTGARHDLVFSLLIHFIKLSVLRHFV